MSEQRVMAEFEIDEISAVDVPAQPHAKMVIMKRDGSGGTPPDEDEAMAELEDEDGEDMEDKRMSDAKKADTAALDALEKRLAKAEERADRSEAIASMNDAQRSYFKTLEGEKATSFLKKSSDDRDAEMHEVQKGDPVVYTTTDGVEIRKSDGNAVLALAKASDSHAKRADAAEKALSDSTYAKRATDTLSHLPGDQDIKVELLKAVDAMPESAREGALALLKAGDAAQAGAFVERGTTGKPGEFSKAEDSLSALAKRFQEENEGTPYAQAYAAVLKTEEGARLYQQTRSTATK